MHGLGEEREHDPVRLLGAQLNRCQSGLLLGPERPFFVAYRDSKLLI